MKRKPVKKQLPWVGRQSKRDLDAWVWVLRAMIAKVIHQMPPKQQTQILDGLLQHIVSHLNWLRDRERKNR
jgi:hypothetical protein